DGFLYSSPGQGGSVKVSAFDLLAAGIPKNTPQFAQVDFAAEALKNFQYNWVKLILNTEGEDLIMQMQMDGKPVQSLPFKYDSQTGLLQRIENTGQGIMQPIRLDVNFRLPVNRFLGYSGKIQDMMKKIK
ncbi:MAG: carboxylate transporter, partial [Desulfobulbaceae bacterium]|nr:carboxylate transporter [Desulfobulbaceae bacterium]